MHDSNFRDKAGMDWSAGMHRGRRSTRFDRMLGSSSLPSVVLVTFAVFAIPAFGHLGQATEAAISGSASSAPIRLDVRVGGSIQAGTASTLAKFVKLVDLPPTTAMVADVGNLQATRHVVNRIIKELIAGSEQNEGLAAVLGRQREFRGSGRQPHIPGSKPGWGDEGFTAPQLLAKADDPWGKYGGIHFERESFAASLTLDQATSVGAHVLQNHERIVRDVLAALMEEPGKPRSAVEALDAMFVETGAGFNTSVSLAKLMEQAQPNRYGVLGRAAFGQAFRLWDEQTNVSVGKLKRQGLDEIAVRRAELDLQQTWVADWARPHLEVAHETLARRLRWIEDPAFLGSTEQNPLRLDVTEDAFEAVDALLKREEFSKLEYADAVDQLNVLATQFVTGEFNDAMRAPRKEAREAMVDGLDVAPIVTDAMPRYSPITMGETIGTTVQPMEMRLRPASRYDSVFLGHDIKHAREEIAPADARLRPLADSVYQAAKSIDDQGLSKAILYFLGDTYRESKALYRKVIDETTIDLFQPALENRIQSARQGLDYARGRREPNVAQIESLERQLAELKQARSWIRTNVEGYLADHHPEVLDVGLTLTPNP